MTSFKLGRQPAQIPAALHDLTYYAAGPLPKPPPSVAAPSVSSYGMLSNDTLGCCGPAGLEHGFMAAAADASEKESFPTAKQCASYYLRYTGGEDSGVVLSDYLAYVQKNKYYSHTVTAYAPVGVHDVPTLQFCVAAYDFAYCGIVVTQAMEDAFGAGEPWTSATNKGAVLGGHCVPAVAYDDEFLTVVTWGALQKIAWPAWHKMSEEAWGVIVGEDVHGDGHGISLAALQADLSKLSR